ncbi:hypothetical protein DTO271G3_3214 [Paecilomyces variotii]|nr:hypothetical protein DTO271G3_3214 [Paecilomyces variotii]
MTSTTLMTFLLRTSPDIRSVQLLGSWDNFSKPYGMEHDKRIGPGHWRGCHTFTNIICDGSRSSPSAGRSGGLKMGGTYWYYYILDNDEEFYNEAEPVTTSCPFLPGQPVNVLNVPVILPDTQTIHKRDSSVGSRLSDQRTMNPEDKYMNPRTPPKPELPRLRTSPPLPQGELSIWSSLLTLPLHAVVHRSASQPASTSSTPDLCPSKEAARKEARSVSPSKSRGLKDALRNWTPQRSAAPHAEESRGRTAARWENNRHCAEDQWLLVPEAGYCSSNCNSRQASPANNEGDSPETLHFRRHHFDTHDGQASLSIQDRRPAKFISRDSSPFGNHLTVNTPRKYATHCDYVELEDTSYRCHSPSSASIGRTPRATEETPTPRAYNNADEKRLPTLPNSPSSVMDEALHALDSENAALDMDVLQSHFSDWTSADESCAEDLPVSRFSAWSTDDETEMVSPASMTSSSTFNNDKHNSPTLNGVSSGLSVSNSRSHALFHGPVTPTLDAIPECSTTTTIVDSSPALPLSSGLPPLIITPDDLRISGLCISTPKEPDCTLKRHAGIFDSFGPRDDIPQAPDSASSAGTIFPEQRNDTDNYGMKADKDDDKLGRFDDSALSRSSIMQELIDELSYLGDVIQVEADNVC